jgi:hypothetical protein
VSEEYTRCARNAHLGVREERFWYQFALSVTDGSTATDRGIGPRAVLGEAGEDRTKAIEDSDSQSRAEEALARRGRSGEVGAQGCFDGEPEGSWGSSVEQ